MNVKAEEVRRRPAGAPEYIETEKQSAATLKANTKPLRDRFAEFPNIASVLDIGDVRESEDDEEARLHDRTVAILQQIDSALGAGDEIALGIVDRHVRLQRNLPGLMSSFSLVIPALDQRIKELPAKSATSDPENPADVLEVGLRHIRYWSAGSSALDRESGEHHALDAIISMLKAAELALVRSGSFDLGDSAGGAAQVEALKEHLLQRGWTLERLVGLAAELHPGERIVHLMLGSVVIRGADDALRTIYASQ